MRYRPSLRHGVLVLSLVGLSMVAEAWSDARLDALGVGAGLLCAVALTVFYLIG